MNSKTVQRSALCGSRRELSNEYLLPKIGVDTAENELLEVWGKLFNIIQSCPYSRPASLLRAAATAAESTPRRESYRSPAVMNSPSPAHMTHLPSEVKYFSPFENQRTIRIRFMLLLISASCLRRSSSSTSSGRGQILIADWAWASTSSRAPKFTDRGIF